MTPKIPERLERLPLERLIPYANNSRTHSEEQVAQIAASIREFGFTNPILIDEADGIIAGHGRLAAAKELGLTHVRQATASEPTANAADTREMTRPATRDLSTAPIDRPDWLTAIATDTIPAPITTEAVRASSPAPRPATDTGDLPSKAAR